MRIGELADRVGITAKTIRYYEDIGLVPEPARDHNDYRDYPEEAVERLGFIRDAQATGLSLTEIASILELRGQGESTCHHVTELLDRHVAALDEHIAALQQTRVELAELTERAHRLDPAQCTDPNRCQTITTSPEPGRGAKTASRHVHVGPRAHRH